MTILKHRLSRIVCSAAALSIIGYGSTVAASTAQEIPLNNKPATATKVSLFPPSSAPLRIPVIDSISRGLPVENDSVLVFSAPPRESEANSIRTYQSIADYLSRIIGKMIIYKHPSDWIVYQTEMQKGNYDLVFDESHLNSWRISNLRHNALVKIADDYTFAVVVRQDNDRVTDVKQLVGQKVCGMSPPDLGTLAVLDKFDNPMRQPLIVHSASSAKVYAGLVDEKRCAAGILPIADIGKILNSEKSIRVLYRTRPLLNQAFSAGPRIARDDQARIAAALLSPESGPALSRLLSAYGTSKGLTYANKEEFVGLDTYLKNSWGYSR